jgi:hypothetical protein
VLPARTIGIIGVYESLRPRLGFEAIPSVDVLRLLGSGMCFGVVVYVLVSMIRRRRGH